LEEVQETPESAAHEVLRLLAHYDHYVIHLDVDVVDFTGAPLSEHPSRNAGLKLASGSGLVAITLNPHNAAADEGLLERFAAAFAEAIGR
jgi:arginase